MSENTTNPRRHKQADEYTAPCSALTKAGLPCPKPAQRDGSGLCWIHACTPAERKRHAATMHAARAKHQERRDLAREAVEPSRHIEPLRPELTPGERLAQLHAEHEAKVDAEIEALLDRAPWRAFV